MSTSSIASASSATARVISPSARTSAKSRTRRSSRLTIRGVPRERRAISCAPAGSIAIFEQPRRARDDARQLLRRVELEPRDDAEAVAQRVGQHAGARGRADQRERRQVELDAARGRAFADHDVDLEILERRIEDFLDDRRQAVDLVDEQHVVRLEVGEQRREVAGALEHRARRLAQVDAELVRDDVRQRRLAEARAGRTAARGRATSLRFLAASMKIDSWPRIFSWPTYSSSTRGRSARSTTSSSPPATLPATRRLSSSFSIIARSCLREQLQRLPDRVADGEPFGQLLHRGDRFLVAVAERSERVQDVGRHRRRRGARRRPS